MDCLEVGASASFGAGRLCRRRRRSANGEMWGQMEVEMRVW